MSEFDLIIKSANDSLAQSQFLHDLKARIEDKFEKECKSKTQKAPENSQSGEIIIGLEIAKLTVPTIAALIPVLLFYLKEKKGSTLTYKKDDVTITLNGLSNEEAIKQMNEIVQKDKKPLLILE